MTHPGRLPDFASSSFRDQCTEDRTDRIWRRLAADLRTKEQAPKSRVSIWVPMGAAAAALIFVAGAIVGQRWSAPDVVAPHVMAEPPAQTDRPGVSQPQTIEATTQPTKPRSTPRRTRTLGRSAPAPAVPEAAREQEEAPPASEPPPAPAAVPNWQVLAGQLDYEAARKALDSEGGFDAALAQAAPEQLMILHDIARATGDRAQALRALQRVVQRFPDDPNAPIAAWSLGNLLEASGNRAGAAEAYSRYRSLSPQGDFAEDALARQVQVAVEQGDLPQARRLASQYEQDFPNGRHSDELQALLEQLVDAGADAGAPSQESQGDSAGTETEDLAPVKGG